MDTVRISTLLQKTTYLVDVYSGEELISSGSAVAINNRGDLLTAAHVVTAGRLPIRQEDVSDPNLIVIARRSDEDFKQYVIPFCGVTVKNEFLRAEITVDIALLRPIVSQEKVQFLRISEAPVQVGCQVIMAGFPDDMELPFSFDRKLDYRTPELQLLKKHLSTARRLLMLKSGMIGSRNGVVLEDKSLGMTLSGEIMYVDNVLHSGASGGPVVNRKCEIIGIITQRAITAVPFENTPNLRVPSGSAVAVSPRMVSPYLKQHGI